MKRKKNNLYEALELKSSKNKNFNQVIKNIRAQEKIIKKHITSHNTEEDVKDEKSKCLKKTYIYLNIMEINNDKEVKEIKQKIEEAKAKILELQTKLKKNKETLNKNQEELNKIENVARKKIQETWQNITGSKKLKLREHKSKDKTEKNVFEILRDEMPATRLSEGEKTALHIAYFFSLLKKEVADKPKMIVFIDDPISSLDDNHLYQVSALLKEFYERDKNYNKVQLFVSTHNFDFFNHIKRWFKERGWFGKTEDRYYQVVQDKDTGSSIKELPDYIKLFETEYVYFFSILRRFQNGEFDAELNLFLPNILRRFLERYMANRYPGWGVSEEKKEGLYEKIKTGLPMKGASLEVLVDILNKLSHGKPRAVLPLKV